MAPEAPIIGSVEVGSMSVWPTTAATPPAR